MPESPLSQLALYTARPTIRINGAEKERVTGLLLAMDMTEGEDGFWAHALAGGAVVARGLRPVPGCEPRLGVRLDRRENAIEVPP